MGVTQANQPPVHPTALHTECTEPASENPAFAFDAASEGSDIGFHGVTLRVLMMMVTNIGSMTCLLIMSRLNL